MLRTASSYLPALNANERFAAFASAPPNPRRSSTPISSSLASLGSRASGSARPLLRGPGNGASGSPALLAPPMWSAKGSISCVLLRSWSRARCIKPPSMSTR